MKNKILHIIIFFALSTFSCTKSNTETVVKSEVFNNSNRPFFEYSATGDYYYCLPWNYAESINAERKYPLVIYLHPSGGAGDIKNLGLYYLGYDTNDGNDDSRAINFQKKHPSFVLVPQTADSWDYNKIISTIEEYKRKYRIDISKIYLIGYSLGGSGSYVLANKYYDYNKQLFASIIRLSGQSESIVENEIAQNTAIWLQIGLNDYITRVTVTQDAYNFLKNFHIGAVEKSENITIAGKTGTTYTLIINGKEMVKKTEYNDVGHEIGSFPFEDGKLIEWMYNQQVKL